MIFITAYKSLNSHTPARSHRPRTTSPVVVITEGYRRMPKDTEIYRKLPKASLKIEYRPNVSGVVANFELEERLGAKPTAGGKAPSRSCANWGIRGRSPLKLNAFFVSLAVPVLQGHPESNHWSKLLPLWRDPFSWSGGQYLYPRKSTGK